MCKFHPIQVRANGGNPTNVSRQSRGKLPGYAAEIRGNKRLMGYPFSMVIDNRLYTIRLARRDMKNGGDVDPPTNKGEKVIRITRGARDAQHHAERLLHEVLHAAVWAIDEEYVTEAAGAQAEALVKAGLLNLDARV